MAGCCRELKVANTREFCNNMVKIGVLGCGAIGSFVAGFVEKNLGSKARISSVCDVSELSIQKISSSLKIKPIVCDIKSLVKNSDIIVEAATAGAVEELLEISCADSNKDIVMLSSGIFSKRPDLINKIINSKVRVHIPSGAVCGIDGIRAGAIGRIFEVTLTTVKPPKAFEGVAYIADKKIDLNNIKTQVVIFDGNAKKACEYFPQNINVASTLALASGLGLDGTFVKIVADSNVKTNSHNIKVRGEFGNIELKVENIVFIDNPKTSKLAAYSTAALVDKLLSNFKIG